MISIGEDAITGAKQVINDKCQAGYSGPGPRDPSVHTYRFALYALGENDISGFVRYSLNCEQFEKFMKEKGVKIIDKARITATFRNPHYD